MVVAFYNTIPFSFEKQIGVKINRGRSERKQIFIFVETVWFISILIWSFSNISAQLCNDYIWVYFPLFKKEKSGNSLVVQWLGLCSSTAKGPASVPDWGTKIPQAKWHGQKNPPKIRIAHVKILHFFDTFYSFIFVQILWLLRIMVYVDLLELGVFLYLSYNLFRHTNALKHWFFSSAWRLPFSKEYGKSSRYEKENTVNLFTNLRNSIYQHRALHFLQTQVTFYNTNRPLTEDKVFLILVCSILIPEIVWREIILSFLWFNKGKKV